MLIIINVQEGQTIFDVLLKSYGGPEFLFKLLSENPNVPNANFDFNANPNTKVIYDDSFSIPDAPALILSAPIIPSNIKSLKGVFGQTIFDILLMSYGTPEKYLKLLQDNNISGLNDDEISQKIFTFDIEQVVDNIYFNSIKNYIIATRSLVFNSFTSGYLTTDDGITITTDDGIPIIVDDDNTDNEGVWLKSDGGKYLKALGGNYIHV